MPVKIVGQQVHYDVEITNDQGLALPIQQPYTDATKDGLKDDDRSTFSKTTDNNGRIPFEVIPSRHEDDDWEVMSKKAKCEGDMNKDCSAALTVSSARRANEDSSVRVVSADGHYDLPIVNSMTLAGDKLVKTALDVCLVTRKDQKIVACTEEVDNYAAAGDSEDTENTAKNNAETSLRVTNANPSISGLPGSELANRLTSVRITGSQGTDTLGKVYVTNEVPVSGSVNTAQAKAEARPIDDDVKTVVPENGGLADGSNQLLQVDSHGALKIAVSDLTTTSSGDKHQPRSLRVTDKGELITKKQDDIKITSAVDESTGRAKDDINVNVWSKYTGKEGTVGAYEPLAQFNKVRDPGWSGRDGAALRPGVGGDIEVILSKHCESKTGGKSDYEEKILEIENIVRPVYITNDYKKENGNQIESISVRSDPTHPDKATDYVRIGGKKGDGTELGKVEISAAQLGATGGGGADRDAAKTSAIRITGAEGTDNLGGVFVASASTTAGSLPDKHLKVDSFGSLKTVTSTPSTVGDANTNLGTAIRITSAQGTDDLGNVEMKVHRGDGGAATLQPVAVPVKQDKTQEANRGSALRITGADGTDVLGQVFIQNVENTKLLAQSEFLPPSGPQDEQTYFNSILQDHKDAVTAAGGDANKLGKLRSELDGLTGDRTGLLDFKKRTALRVADYDGKDILNDYKGHQQQQQLRKLRGRSPRQRQIGQQL